MLLYLILPFLRNLYPPEQKQMRVGITGVSGVVGTQLAKRFVEEGIEYRMQVPEFCAEL
jgi:nucleoside-triphosphatase THEP1